MKIALVRHGKPCPTGYAHRWIISSEVKQWVAAYDRSPLDLRYEPGTELRQRAFTYAAAVCSNLPRSIQSAAALGFHSPIQQSALFREADLPHLSIPFVRLRIRHWAFICRSLWFTGYSAGNEPIRKARKRYARAAEELMDIASRYGSVLLFGHGFTNRFIAKELRSQGWTGEDVPARCFWGMSEYFAPQ